MQVAGQSWFSTDLAGGVVVVAFVRDGAATGGVSIRRYFSSIHCWQLGECEDGEVSDRTELGDTPAGVESEGALPRRRPRPLVLISLISVVVVLVDQLTKLWATSRLEEGVYHSLIGKLFGLQLTYNPGAAFSFLVNATWVFTIIAAAAVFVLVVFSRRVGSLWWAADFGLLLGGAVTHLGDRLLRAPSFGQGRVVDFIAYSNWFIGNVADIAVFCGALLALVLTMFGVPLRGGPRHEPASP